MLRALGRFLSALLYYCSFGLIKMSESIEAKPGVVKEQYRQVIQEKKRRMQQYVDAVAEIGAIREKKKGTLARLYQEIEKLTSLKSGSAAMAQKEVAKLRAAGKGAEEIAQDPTVQKCQAAFKDFKSTLSEKESRCAELEQEITSYDQKMEGHRLQLQSLQRDLEKLKSESAEAVADIITAQEEKRVADLVSGISEDGTDETLERLRDMRQKAKVEATVANELAGTDTKRQEAEFLEFAKKNEADDEFAALIGLAEDKGSNGPRLLTEGRTPETLDGSTSKQPAVVKAMGPRLPE